MDLILHVVSIESLVIRMSTPLIPHAEWREFLESFSSRHAGWLVSIETHDLKTAERVRYPFVRLESVELDLEDRKNPRINVAVRDGQKQIKHILFRPAEVRRLLEDTNVEALRITSLNTVTTVRFRVPAAPEVVDGVA
jgi:hypothetical protein